MTARRVVIRWNWERGKHNDNNDKNDDNDNNDNNDNSENDDNHDNDNNNDHNDNNDNNIGRGRSASRNESWPDGNLGRREYGHCNG